MKELTNSCCLQHVSGGAFGWTGDDCPGCRGDWDKQDKNSQSQNSRGTVVWIGSWIGGAAGAVASTATGVGLGASSGNINVNSILSLKSQIQAIEQAINALDKNKSETINDLEKQIKNNQKIYQDKQAYLVEVEKTMNDYEDLVSVMRNY